MITSKNDDLLANATIGKTFCRLAIPAVAAQLINILYNLVDKMFIGHIPDVGSQALAGVGVTTPVILVISAFAALVSMGGAPKATIFMGKGQHQEAEKVLGSCTWMLVLLSLLLTLVMLLFEHPVLMLFGASNETIGFASDYMRIYCLGTLFTQLTLGLNAFITAQGNTFVSMYNVAIGAISNILLDAVFINTFGMGVKGAALATVEPKVKAAMGKNFAVYRSEPYFLEVLPKGIDKAQSLERLLQHLGMTKEEMIACGDGYNDLTMIQYAGLGVAMENAVLPVRKAADYITASNNDDGVGLVVEKFMLA